MLKLKFLNQYSIICNQFSTLLLFLNFKTLSFKVEICKVCGLIILCSLKYLSVVNKYDKLNTIFYNPHNSNDLNCF